MKSVPPCLTTQKYHCTAQLIWLACFDFWFRALERGHGGVNESGGNAVHSNNIYYRPFAHHRIRTGSVIIICAKYLTDLRWIKSHIDYEGLPEEVAV